MATTTELQKLGDASPPDQLSATATSFDPSDLTIVDPSIYKVFYQVYSQPSASDLEHNTDNMLTGEVMSDRAEVVGWLIWDWSNGPQWQVFMALCWTVFLVNNATQYACESLPYGCDINSESIPDGETVTVSLLGSQILPASFYFIVVSFSGAIQLVAYIMVGGLMDYGTYQFQIFRVCSVVGALFDAPYIFLSSPDSFYFAGFWTAVGIVFYGISTISYNSQLVDITENHWLVARAARMGLTSQQRYKVRERVVDDLSNYGTVFSYTGSLFMTIVAVAIFAAMGETTTVTKSGYGDVHDNGWQEMYAKQVTGANLITCASSTVFANPQIISIQLIYGEINLPGLAHPDNTAILATINDTCTSHSYTVQNTAISKVYIHYNTDNTLSGLQLEASPDDISALFGTESSITDTVSVTEHDETFLLGGYTLYNDDIGDYQVISGFDLLFVSPSGQYPSTLPLRIVVLAVFLFWMGFQTITLFTMKKRVKPPIPADANIFTVSAKNTYKTISETFAKYQHIRSALIAWFFYSDAIGTAMNASILFAQIELGFDFLGLTLLLLEFEVVSAFGGVFHLRLQKWLGWDSRRMMIYHLMSYSCLVGYVLIGLIPNVPFGLVNPWEMWMMNFLYALHAGSLVGFGRSLTSSLIPVGKENEMFSLFAITDKGSSWIGPLIMGVLSNVFGLRWPLLYVLMFFLIAIPIIYNIDIEEGLRQAGRLDDAGDGGGADKDKMIRMLSDSGDEMDTLKKDAGDGDGVVQGNGVAHDEDEMGKENVEEKLIAADDDTGNGVHGIVAKGDSDDE